MLPKKRSKSISGARRENTNRGQLSDSSRKRPGKVFENRVLHFCCDYQKHVTLRRELEVSGFRVDRTENESILLVMLRENTYQVVILTCESTMNRLRGLCSLVRSSGYTGLLITVTDELRIGFEAQLFEKGADDVVTGIQAQATALITRIRTHLHYRMPSTASKNKIKLNGVWVDLGRREIIRNRTRRPLPGLLFDLLSYFIDNADHVVTRQELEKSSMWVDSICTPANEGGNTYDVHVSKLRKIIEADPDHPTVLVTVRGKGWKLNAADSRLAT
jgi:two-component system response regulator RegX3